MRWVAIPVAAVIGIAQMVLLGFTLASLVPLDTSNEGWLAIRLGMGVFCYLVTGIIAGAWANWRGATYGTFAAMVVWAGNLFYGLVAFGPTGYPGPTSPFVGIFMWSHFVGGFFAFVLGALGGFIGERVRQQ